MKRTLDSPDEREGMGEKTVFVVHCVDAEGPLAETGLSLDVKRSGEREWGLQRYSGWREAKLMDVIEWHRTRTLGSWEEICAMLRMATSEAQRHRVRDGAGGGWIFNWFCMDHIGFIDNPRRRAMGIHQVFDFYSNLVKRQGAGDAVHWHFHPMSTYREAHKCATSYLRSPHLWEILNCRVLDRKWFPIANRAGFQDERPDSHWFLEQWIPLDFSNTATTDVDPGRNADLVDGRFADWRWAPSDWRTYRPDHDCYQREGHCRRKIARCLNLLNRFANVDEPEVRAAFARAATGKPTLLGIASHDWRDLNAEMDYFRHLLGKVKMEFPDVTYRFSEAVAAFNAVDPPTVMQPIALRCRLILDEGRRPKRLNVEVTSGSIFGPQPYLAIRTRSRMVLHDNMNYWRSLNDFNYVFDDESIVPEDVQAVGVAANDEGGNQSIHVIDVDEIQREGWREAEGVEF